MDEILASLKGEHLYPLYIYLSQFVHGGHAATWLYRAGLGVNGEPGEYIEPNQWYLPLRIWGDIVTVHTPRLGALINRVNHSDKTEPWTFGIGAMISQIARR